MTTKTEIAVPQKVFKYELGPHNGIPFDEYQKIKAMNNSGLKLFHESAATYIDDKNHPKPTTHDFKVGHATHCAIFEPELFDKLYIKSKHAAFRSDEAKIWRETAIEEGFTVLKSASANEDQHRNPSEWDMVNYIADAVRKHPIARCLIDGHFERTLLWIDKKYKTGRLCKSRMDCQTEAHSMIVDFKSAVDSSFEGFRKQVNQLKYFRQHCWYMDGAVACNLDVKNGFIFIVAEKQPPWQVQLYKLDPMWLDLGWALIERDMDHYALCKEADIWPGYGCRVVRDEKQETGFRVDEIPVRDLTFAQYAHYQPVF